MSQLQKAPRHAPHSILVLRCRRESSSDFTMHAHPSPLGLFPVTDAAAGSRYPSLLPAGQRSFGPQPALGVGRALGLRAYFNQMRQRNAAAGSQGPSSQPAAGDAFPPTQPSRMSQPSWSESQDPQALSFSEQQYINCSQPQQVRSVINETPTSERCLLGRHVPSQSRQPELRYGQCMHSRPQSLLRCSR